MARIVSEYFTWTVYDKQRIIKVDLSYAGSDHYFYLCCPYFVCPYVQPNFLKCSIKSKFIRENSARFRSDGVSGRVDQC